MKNGGPGRFLHHYLFLLFLFGGGLLVSCSKPVLPVLSVGDDFRVYYPKGKDTLVDNAPVFFVRNAGEPYNRIGTPTLHVMHDGKMEVTVSTDLATVYAEEREWQGTTGTFINLFYRLHFSEVPLSLMPFYLTAGRNVGLLVIVTLNKKGQPLLYTILHTCGCYLSFIPTADLSSELYPPDWPGDDRQYIFGENLPSRLPVVENGKRLHILLREGTHRVENVWIGDDERVADLPITFFTLHPLLELENLTTEEGDVGSFFETRGGRKDYVVGSQKIWERLLISWWALDWRVGEDKRIGENSDDGVVFYTSLKPWARKASDLRDFSGFMRYWGWGL